MKTHLVLSALGVERQNGKVGPVGVPVEGHVGRAGRDEVAMGAVAADRLKAERTIRGPSMYASNEPVTPHWAWKFPPNNIDCQYSPSRECVARTWARWGPRSCTWTP